MRRILLLGIMGFLALTAGMGTADDIALPHVTVYGTATLNVTPDQMLWSLCVKNKGAALDKAAEQHARTVQTVLAFLKQSQIEEKNIQTSRMEFGENWEYRDRTRVREGYYASTYISFKLTDFGKYDGLWMGLARIPDVSVKSVTYDNTKKIEYQNEARENALLAAKEKAVALAKALGAEIGEPLLVEEDLSRSSLWLRSANIIGNRLDSSSDGSRIGDGLAPGTIPIQVTVKAAFRLLTAGK